MDDIFRIIKSKANLGVLIDGVSEIVKHEIKKFLFMLLGTVGGSMLGNISTGRGVMRAGKDVLRAGSGHNTMDHMSQNF